MTLPPVPSGPPVLTLVPWWPRLWAEEGPAGRERGQMLVLGTATVALVLALLLVVASATSAYLDLKTLTSLADSAAAAGASGPEESSYYNDPGQGPGSLTAASAEAAARADVAAQAAAVRVEGVHVVQAQVVDGSLVVVTLSARSRFPFLPRGLLPGAGLTITATGSARIATVP